MLVGADVLPTLTVDGGHEPLAHLLSLPDQVVCIRPLRCFSLPPGRPSLRGRALEKLIPLHLKQVVALCPLAVR